MALRYAMADLVAAQAKQIEQDDGVIVIESGELNEAKFIAIYDGQPLQDRQHLLRYRKRGDAVLVGLRNADGQRVGVALH